MGKWDWRIPPFPVAMQWRDQKLGFITPLLHRGRLLDDGAMLDDNVTQQYQIRSQNIDFIYKLSTNNISLQVKTLNSFQMFSSSNISIQQSAST